MKIIKKSKIASSDLNPQMVAEKNVMLENSHPFLIGLKYSFQTEKKLYLVMEYCPGGELYTYLASNKKFSIEVSRFIAAEVLLGMNFSSETNWLASCFPAAVSTPLEGGLYLTSDPSPRLDRDKLIIPIRIR